MNSTPKTNILALLATILMLPILAVQGQTVQIRLDSLQADSGQVFSIPLRVWGFSSITSAQFSVTWDPAVLTFEALDLSQALLALTPANFNTNQAAAGKIGFLWVDLSGRGITLADSSQLFALQFKATGSRGSTSTITLGNDPVMMAIEVFNGALNMVVIPGMVAINPLVGIPYVDLSAGVSLFPNPCTEYITLRIGSPPNGTWTLQILDMVGKTVARYTTSGASSTQNLVLPRLPAGLYVMYGRNADFYFHAKLQVVQK